MSEELIVYTMGIVSCSVCTSITDVDLIEKIVNYKYPTGIKSKWKISKKSFYQDGEPNTCNEKPKTHYHYLLEC